MTTSLRRAGVASALVVAVAFVAFFHATRGLTVLTSEAARRSAIARAPVVVPDPPAVDHMGRVHGLWDEPSVEDGDARVIIAGFMYTGCATFCSALAGTFQQLQREIRSRHLERRVRLVSVSFDKAHDTSDTLARYATLHRVDPTIWTLESPLRAIQLSQVLTAFGIVVVPLPSGDFQHNEALHIVDSSGHLVRIVDADNPAAALDQALAVTDSRPGPG